MRTTTEHDTELRRRFREAHGYRPDTLSTDEAEHRMAEAAQAICALVAELDDERSPLVDALAAVAAAETSRHADGHPSAVVRMSEHLDAIQDAHRRAGVLVAELGRHRAVWSRASQDALAWRDLEQHD